MALASLLQKQSTGHGLFLNPYFYSSCLHICVYAGTIIMFAVLRGKNSKCVPLQYCFGYLESFAVPQELEYLTCQLQRKKPLWFGRGLYRTMGQSRMAMLLISIDILLAINNSKSLPLPRSFLVPLVNDLYFSIHRSCMPFAKYISVYFTVFLVSLADCLGFLYIGPCLWTEKVWIPPN